MRLVLFLLFFLEFSLIHKAVSQQGYYVNIHVEGEEILDFGFLPDIKYDSLTVLHKINEAILSLRSKNYMLSNLDSIRFENEYCTAFVYISPQIFLGDILIDETTFQWVNPNAWGMGNHITDSLFFTNYLNQIQKKLINSGYPFAKIGFSEVEIKDDKLNASLTIDKGNYIVYDTISRLGNNFVSRNYLSHYLRIKQDEPYNHKEILAIKQRIDESGFISMEKDPWVTFVKDKAIVRLPVESKKSNTFDFVIGVLPNTVNGQRRWNINGQAYLDLLNKLGQGERITLDFKRLSEEDQFLSIQASYPYIAGLTIGADGYFELRRNRDISIDLNSNFGGQFLLGGFDYIKAFGVYKTSSIINIDTSLLLASAKLPNNLDYRYRGGGVGINKQKFDYRFNPSNGWQLYTDVNFGQRTIIPNQSILNIKNEQVDFASSYDTLKRTSFQLNLNLKANLYYQVFERGVLKMGFTSGYRFNDGVIIENELYRIGGNKLLRGFDEQTLFTDAFGVLTAEFRFILDQNSYFSFPFIDFSRLRTYTLNESAWDTAFGIGLGLNFATKTGIFNVAFASGKYNQSPFDFNNTKVHFGFVSIF